MPLGFTTRRSEIVTLQKWSIVGITIGILVGIASIVFYEGVKLCTFMLLRMTGYIPPEPEYNVLLPELPANLALLLPVMLLGGVLTGLLIRIAPEIKGGGLDAAIRAFHSPRGEIRSRVPLLKVIASSITIGSGGSAGREGPMGQIGAGIGSFVAGIFKLSEKERRIAISAGIGSGFGAIFKAPLGGALMGTEVLYTRDFEKEALIPAIIASIVGYTIFSFYTDTTPVFLAPEVGWSFQQIPFYMVLGVVTGGVGILYIKALETMEKLFSRIKLPLWVKPAVGLTSLALITIFLFGALPAELKLAPLASLGVGYGFIQLAIFNSLSLEIMLAIAVLKILYTSITIGSGASGGDFAPGLVIGAMVGGALGKIFHMLFPQIVTTQTIPAFVIIGMLALFGGASKAPISVILMVSEMTSSYSLLFPSLIAIVGSYMITGRHSLYKAQVPTRLHSPIHLDEYFCDLLKVPRVRDAMRRDFPTATKEETLKEAMLKMRHGISALPVIEDGRLIGVVRLRNIVSVPFERWSITKVREVMRREYSTISPEKTLFEALRMMEDLGVGTLLVVSRDNPEKVEGVLLKRDIVKLMEGLER